MKPIKRTQIFTMLLTFVLLHGYSQSKIAYLEKNRFDLNSSAFDFPERDFNIIGFGAYHGSAKTEQTEYALLRSLTKEGLIQYYLPETDFSIGHFFNEYLQTGDTLLLKDLIYNYGIRVPQERSIETYEKWKKIKELNDDLSGKHKLTVVGIDLLVSYKYTCKHLLEIIDYKQNQEKSLLGIVNMVVSDTTDFSPYYDSYSKKVLKNFVEDYEINPAKFETVIKDKFVFDHLIENLKSTFENFGSSSNREKIIYDNYLRLNEYYNFDRKRQFVRFGFFHLEKEREGNNASFFTRLIEGNIYQRNKIITVIGYLTNSRVLWDIVYDDHNNYKSYTTEGGYGIGDYEKEYFLGIGNLKNAKNSDITLFRLNQKNTPYSNGIPDLMEIVMEDDTSNGEQVKGKSTTEFLDYAVLISNSKANTPIEEIK
ncbi:erythromycin esterase family protein [Robertkochia solimangrovi]|uniref:erythromycin esterase family protein n=1 Tax=Robertkochia solimangrovi TaxID=2213046 RepID=UPI00117C2438|nr:erythromycin esterase family protein [Robertkochia solimangrovi]TRZ41826.1 hypothetical protein DMZ48_15890 [Robertkochia solimangrovi]